MSAAPRIGADAVAAKGWLGAHRWLLARRVCQLGILALFLLGPLAGLWIVKGNLAYSLTLGTLHLADPFVVLQSLLARHVPERAVVIGALTVLAFYLAVGGRAYCAWVCPLNIVTDAAHWGRERLGITGQGARLSPRLRYWVLGVVLVLAAVSGTLAWEMVNPVSMLHRGLIFGMGAGWFVVAAVFFFDLMVTRRGWCGHVCPAGAFYGLVNRWSPLKVNAAGRAACNDCAECFAVCPEPQVIKPALKGAKLGIGPVILDAACTNCGRCIDVCSRDVFAFGSRFAGDEVATRERAPPAGAGACQQSTTETGS
ncbi:MAG: quinol dehydrogenase ferredoxin subunit NapH [Gammaproteobacteria bacterium]|nr:quinol dehydrogenase ferredoxin subunit NapH [Gammaproteobacteria bacterium]